MHMTEEIEVLKLVAERLGRAEIPYMLVGSVAANYYSTPRMTRDIDILFLSDKNLITYLLVCRG